MAGSSTNYAKYCSRNACSASRRDTRNNACNARFCSNSCCPIGAYYCPFISLATSHCSSCTRPDTAYTSIGTFNIASASTNSASPKSFHCGLPTHDV